MFESYLYIVYIICIMIISGLIKDYNLFSDFYSFLIKNFHSKKLIIFLISCFGGVLPIPGRVIVSAGILDTVVDKKSKSRKKLGVIDFLSTHHYYWWSPLEKTVAIPMAVFSLSYFQFLSYVWVPLLISLIFIFYHIFFYLNEDEIVINKEKNEKNKNIFILMAPLLISIFLMFFKIKPYFIFPITSLIYIQMTKEYRIKKILSYVNWKLIFIVFIVLTLSTIFKMYNDRILIYLENISTEFHITTLSGFLIISSLVFLFSFLLGSSSKYAGIVSLVCSIVGLEFLTFFLIISFSAYILSPTHKCVLISSQYFNTPLKEYYKILLLWSGLLISYGFITLIAVF